jgi:FKBP-type peptidyl-prolyl cis-trans isomerase SlyD
VSDAIQEGKFVELTYKVVDDASGETLIAIEYPLGYVHGMNEVLAREVTQELEGRQVGDIIEVSIDCNQLYGPRNESLVFTDHIENVPEEYRELGATITMESESGQTRTFIVTRMDENTLTVDGNNPLCGREVTFVLEVLNVRDATDDELALGGAVGDEPDLNEILNNEDTVLH